MYIYLILGGNFRDNLHDRALKLFNADIFKYNRPWGEKTNIRSNLFPLKGSEEEFRAILRARLFRCSKWSGPRGRKLIKCHF